MILLQLQLTLALLLAATARAQDPIRIQGSEQSLLNSKLPDGGIPPVVGVQNIQVFRPSRDAPQIPAFGNWTYNHHVDICCWKGRLYVAWDSGQKDEDTWPAHELFSSSTDGLSWTAPSELFPLGISNPLRMYFYHAASGHMLVIAARRVVFGTMTDAVQGGVVVRELLADHSLGPVFTLIKSPAAPAGPAYFESSTDETFVQSCQQLLADHTFLEQQDYGVLLKNNRMKPYDGADSDFGKAFCFFHRLDGTLVGICKKGWVVESTDKGLSWQGPTKLQQFTAGTAKEWIQRTSDGKFAWAHDPFSADRFPLVILAGTDGITFSSMRVVHGEVPRQRYAGLHKNLGPQYVRGISDWNTDGSRADPALWLAYSVNKEDIWVSRVPVPLASESAGWNTYAPKWANVSVKQTGDAANLTLEDRDPYDYARADHIFPPAAKLTAEFEVLAQHLGPRNLEIELWGQYGDARPARIALKPDGNIQAGSKSIAKYSIGQRIKFKITADTATATFDIAINDGPPTALNFADKSDSLARLVFRTGEYRLLPTRGNEIPSGSDKPTVSSEYSIRNLKIR